MSERPHPGAPDDDLELPGYGPAVLLTQGGYSHIYRVHQPQFDRSVAVKVLAFALTDYKAQRRFQRECRLAGRLSAHPNIVTVHDAGIAPDGRPYITMEYFPAGSLADRVHRDGPFKVSDALRIAIACAGALETAHRAGVIHRDVKPANVLLTSYGQPALADFGLSVLAERQAVTAGADALTPFHAPPEMLERSAATPRSDVYSLASTVYTMLAGRAPHQGVDDGHTSAPTVGELLLSILQQDVPPIDRPGIPQSLQAALAEALARDPAERTPTALAFAQALQEVQLQLGYEVTDPIVIDVDTGASRRGAGAGATEAGAGAGAAGAASLSTSLSPSPWPSPSPSSEGSPALPGDGGRGNGGDGTGRGDGVEVVVGELDPTLLGGPGARDDPQPWGDWAGGPEPSGGTQRHLGDVTVERAATPAPLPRPLARVDPRQPRRDWRVVAVAGVMVAGGLAIALALQSGGGDRGAEPIAGRDSGQAGEAGGDPAGRGDRGDRGADGAEDAGGAGTTDAGAVPGSGGLSDDSGDGGDRGGDGAGSGDGSSGAGAEPHDLTAIESEAGVHLEWSGDEDARHVVLVLSETEPPQVRDEVEGLSDLVTAPELRPDEGYCFTVARLDAINDLPSDETIDAPFGPIACIRGASRSSVLTD